MCRGALVVNISLVWLSTNYRCETKRSENSPFYQIKLQFIKIFLLPVCNINSNTSSCLYANYETNGLDNTSNEIENRRYWKRRIKTPRGVIQSSSCIISGWYSLCDYHDYHDNDYCDWILKIAGWLALSCTHYQSILSQFGSWHKEKWPLTQEKYFLQWWAFFISYEDEQREEGRQRPGSTEGSGWGKFLRIKPLTNTMGCFESWEWMTLSFTIAFLSNRTI